MRRVMNLAHRHRLAGQQGFVGCKAAGLDDQSIGRHPVTFGQDDQIAQDHFTPGNAQTLPVADDQRAWAGQIAQGIQNLLGPRLLNHGDTDGQAGEDQQNDRLFQIAQHQIDQATAQQQRQHRLFQNLKHDADPSPALGLGQFIGAIRSQPAGGFSLGQAGQGQCFGGHLRLSAAACERVRSPDRNKSRRALICVRPDRTMAGDTRPAQQAGGTKSGWHRTVPSWPCWPL